MKAKWIRRLFTFEVEVTVLDVTTKETKVVAVDALVGGRDLTLLTDRYAHEAGLNAFGPTSKLTGVQDITREVEVAEPDFTPPEVEAPHL